MSKRLASWLLGAAAGVLVGGLLAMEAVAQAEAASLTISIELDGRPAAGAVEVLDVSGNVAVRGVAGQTLHLPAGRYSAVVRCDAIPSSGSSRSESRLSARAIPDLELAARSSVRRTVRFTSPAR
ncbi:MAG: hypothetical protein HYY06_07905 [Deltaproteobacteria bacterium]|nr:hypothetical protein [Deltaproteobacteria bacterium]